MQNVPQRNVAAMNSLSVLPDMAKHWNEWLLTLPSASYCHRYEWRAVLHEAYGLPTSVLAVTDLNGGWVGGCLVAEMPRLIFSSRRAVALPYCNYGGMIALPGVDLEAVRLAVLRVTTELGIARVEFREMHGAVDSEETTLILSLPASRELLWSQVGDKVRNQVRKAERSGLTVHWGAEQWPELYEIYARNMGRLGTPVHSPRFIQAIVENFGADAEVLTVRLDGMAVGAMLLIKHAGVWADPMASCLSEYNKLNPNMLLYWSALAAACDAGADKFDFGRSQRDSGTYRFKRQWGAEAIPLCYLSFVDGVCQRDSSTGFYRSSTGGRLAAIWRRMPYGVQSRLGPMVRRWLP